LPVLKALKELKIPIVLMPAADSSPDGSAWLRRDDYQLKAGLNNRSTTKENSRSSLFTVILNRLVQRWLPFQVYNSPWGKMLFYSSPQALLLKTMGMLPRNPWAQGTTFADHIMISGPDEESIYTEAGMSSDRLLFYGSHELDVLYEHWRNRAAIRDDLMDAYRLENHKKILILSLPRLWEQGLASEEVHWQAINEILNVSSHQDCNVVVSLHPNSNLSHYDWIEEKYPVKICRESLTDILVAADIFVASYSSTIRWAIGLGIPVINLDFWSLDWNMYVGLTGFQTANTASELENMLQVLAATENIDHLDRGPSVAGDTNTVLVDGRAKDRLLSFIHSLNGTTASTPAAAQQPERVL